jgi:hypothetical protein
LWATILNVQLREEERTEMKVGGDKEEKEQQQ